MIPQHMQRLLSSVCHSARLFIQQEPRMAQMEAWISMSAQLAVIFSHGILGFQQRTGSGWGAVEGFGRTILLSLSPPPFSTHPEQTGPDPNPGLNPFHQSDLRKKHSSIPERRRHISRSSGNRGRLMKCRLALQRERGGKNRLPNKVIEKFDDVRFQSTRAPCRRRVFGFRLSAVNSKLMSRK